jgi:RNA polymerase sigma-70 factor (ECF subfamily)
MITASQLEEHRRALTGHCYRMLGSAAEADDAVQKTMARAGPGLDRLEGRASLRTSMYRIATRVCLDALADRTRRARPMELAPAGSVDDPLTALPGSRWIEPIPDAQVLPADADPAERALLRESIRLAFVAALQHLPPRQRAALLLTEVLGWSAAEVADSLDTSVGAVDSAVQQGRATLAAREPDRPRAPLPESQAALLARYVEAFERFDVDLLTGLLHEDAILSMPPYELWLRGSATIHRWLLARGAGCRGSRLVPTAACGLPAFAQYRPGGPGSPPQPWALIVLELAGDRISAMTAFLDTEALFPRFGLPATLPRW